MGLEEAVVCGGAGDVVEWEVVDCGWLAGAGSTLGLSFEFPKCGGGAIMRDKRCGKGTN